MSDKKFYPATYVYEPVTVRKVVKQYGVGRMLIGTIGMLSVLGVLTIAGVMFG